MNEEQLKKDKLLLEHWKEQCDIAAKIDGEAHLSQFGINQLLEAQKRVTEEEVRREASHKMLKMCLNDLMIMSCGCHIRLMNSFPKLACDYCWNLPEGEVTKGHNHLSPNPEQDD